jgi:KDO2-lipid IV(A) lauroyltransferase
VSRLQKAAGAAVILAYAERLAAGVGYRLHLQRMSVDPFDEATLNRAVESVIRRCPAQYLWGYNRFKVPAGVAAPQMTDQA